MVLSLNHKVIDKKDNYELLGIDLDINLRNCKYLKMVNPSLQIYHLEGVAPECQNVQQAINFRAAQLLDKNENWIPAIIT